MNEIYTTIQGRLVAAPESRTTRGGVPFTSFRIASTVRRPNPQTKEYEDGPTSFFNVTAFRTLGANVGNSLKKGDPVVVFGRMRMRLRCKHYSNHLRLWITALVSLSIVMKSIWVTPRAASGSCSRASMRVWFFGPPSS